MKCVDIRRNTSGEGGFLDCKPLSLVTKKMTVAKEEAPANYVPAAAVIRRVQALSGFTGCKGRVDGKLSQM